MDARESRRRAKWVARWRSSGCSAREFGAVHGLKASSLYEWSRAYRDVSPGDEAVASFTEVRVREERVGSTEAIEIVVGARVVRVRAGVDLEFLAAVLALVSRC